MKSCSIKGLGYALAKRRVTNEDLSTFVDTNDEWISSRTGIRARYISEEENTSDLGARAARMAIDKSGIDPKEIDLIITATFTPDQTTPSTACLIQEKLGLNKQHMMAFDLNAACSGFLFAYQTAQAYISSGIYKNILVVGSERLSRIVDWKDRGTCILFGDGAGAVMLCAREGRNYASFARSDGRGGEALTCPAVKSSLNREPQTETAGSAALKSEKYLFMDGREVFQFAVRSVPEAIRRVLEKNNLKTEEIDWFILHQANRRIVEAAARRLGMGIERFPMNLQEYGNTSSASIPILLHEMNRNGKLKKGQKLVLAGFGAGLSWGASVLEWGI